MMIPDNHKHMISSIAAVAVFVALLVFIYNMTALFV